MQGPSLPARALLVGLSALLCASLVPGSPAAAAELPLQPAEPAPVAASAVELEELRTATTKVFSTEEPGVLEARTFAGPVHFLDDAGGWRDIDPTLVPSDVPGVYEGAANSALVQIAGDASAPALGRVELDPEHSVEFGLQGAAPVLAEPVGDAIDYPGVLPGATLRLTSQRAGLKEEIVLDSATAGTVFVFPMRLQGLSARLSETGGVEYVDDAGVVLLTTPQPFMVDSAKGTGGAAAEPHFGATYALAELPGGVTALTMTLDQQWLQAPERVFPVTVDPSYQFSPAKTKQDDTYVATTPPGDRSGLPVLRIGHYEGDLAGRTRRTYMHFDVLRGVDVKTSRLQLRITPEGAPSCTATTMDLHKVTGSWVGSSVAMQDLATAASVASTATLSSSSQGANADCTGDVALSGGTLTSLLESWSTTPTSNNGLMLKARDESDAGTLSYREFTSYDGATLNSLEMPYLGYTYSVAPNVPEQLTPTDNAASGTLTPSLSGRFSDRDLDSGRLDFEVYPAGSPTLLRSGSGTTVSSGSRSSWRVPSGLTVGQSYEWRARARDSGGLLSAWSVRQLFRATEPAPPSAPDAPQASAGDGEANVHFEPPATNGSGVIGYIVTATPGGQAVAVGPDVRLATVTGLTNGTTYTFTVRARSFAGESPESKPSNPVTPSAGVSPTPGTATSDAVVEPAPMAFPPPNAGTGTMPALTDGPRAPVPGAAPETLGFEDWQSYTGMALGGQGQASVNVANGNLVVQSLDSTPVQAHGRLSYTLRRTYNSQAPADLVAVPGSIGAGWSLNLGEEAGDFTSVGLTGDTLTGAAGGLGTGDTGALSALTPGNVTLVDRDGTRHTFTPRPLATAVTSPLTDDPTAEGVSNVARRALTGSTGALVCVDTVYSSPQGVHASLFRFLQVGAGEGCPGASGPSEGSVVLGYAMVRPDRVRVEYAATGQILSMTDAAGVELRYAYEREFAPGTPLGRLSRVYEPRSCTYTRSDPSAPGTLPAGCRSFTLTYPDDQVRVVDPAGRATVYRLTTPVPGGPSYLATVTNPDGSVLKYSYQGVVPIGATQPASCGGDTGQLCSVTDGRGALSRFGYLDDGSLVTTDRPRAVSMTDRRGLTSDVGYGSSITTVTTGERRTVFAGIDAAGRVGRVLQGDTAGVLYRDTTTTWDTATATCRQPDPKIDHNRCAVLRRQVSTATGAAPSQQSRAVFNEQGIAVIARQTNATGGQDVTTSGFRVQHVGPTKTRLYTDRIDGSGRVVSSNGAAGTRTDDGEPTLFVLADRTETLTARGNAAPGVGSGTTANPDWRAYRTGYRVDATETVAAGSTPKSGVCGSVPTNTGLVCEAQAPAYNSTATSAGQPTRTRFGYDSFGQRTTMTTPKAIAETPAGAVPPSYRYEYFADSARDLSGLTSAGGWLRAVVDPAGAFVAYGHDRAGNAVRTWDRNATAGKAVADFPGTIAAPPNDRYREQLYAPTTAGRDVSPTERTNALRRPWRYLRSDRDALGNRALVQTDPNGNVLRTTAPRGTQLVAAGTQAPPTYDTVMGYDAGDLPTAVTLPADRQVNGSDRDRPTQTTYDRYGNPYSRIDPRGVVTAFDHDHADRLVATTYSRGTHNAQAPRACRASTSADAPRYGAGVTLCRTQTRYDGLDQPFATSDGNGQVGTARYDALGRQVSGTSPRGQELVAETRTETLFNADGQPTSVCRPRQFSEGTGGCTASSRFATHTAYDVAGRPVSTTGFRDAAGTQPLTSRVSYDADGNPVSTTNAKGKTSTAGFDLLDRMTSSTRPRTATTGFTTRYGYDRVGNRTSVITPVAGTETRTDAYSYDAMNRLVDTVAGASSPDAGAAGPASADGGSNTRTRRLYDADGRAVAAFSPRAFATSVTAPDPRFLTRTDVDANGRPTASFRPRYDKDDPNSVDPTGTAGDAAGEQAKQCPTGITAQPVDVPASMTAVPAWPARTGVCVTRTRYDSAGQPVIVTLPTADGAQPGGTTTRQVTMSWTDDRLLAEQSTPSPTGDGVATTRSRYDAMGRPLAVTDALGKVSVTGYTRDGLVAVSSQPGYKRPDGTQITHRSESFYDADGNATRTLDGLKRETVTVLTADGLTAESRAPGGLTTRYGYDQVGAPVSVHSPSAVAKDATNPTGAPTTYTYTDDDLLLSSTQPINATSSRRTTWSYDEGGRKSAQRAELLGGAAPSQRFAYYPNSALRTETGRAGETITRSYDPAGNPTRTADSTNTSATVTGTFYLDDLPRTVADGKEDTRLAYDGAGQVLRRAQGPTGAAASAMALSTFTYRDAGTPASARSSVVAQSTGKPWSWQHDALGRPTAETAPNGQVTSWSYQPDDTPLEKTTRATGDPASKAIAEWRYAYDNLERQRVSEHTALKPDGSSKSQRHTFDYDLAGRLTSTVDDQGPHTITFDANGNRRTYSTLKNGVTSLQTSSYNADDSIAKADDGNGGPALPSSYDASGNLTSDGCYSYRYDGFDRTAAALANTGKCASADASADTTYTYDGLDRQRSRTQTTTSTTVTTYTDGTTSKASSTATATTAMNYDAMSNQIVAEQTTPAGGAAEPVSRYTHNPTGTPLALTSGANTAPKVEYLTDDGHGSITTITTPDVGTATTGTGSGAGAVSCATRFDPWGKPRTDTTTGSSTGTDTALNPTGTGTTSTTGTGIGLAPSPCQTSVNDGSPSSPVSTFYRGERRDTGTGNYQLGSRTYDPAKAAFLSQDTYRNDQPGSHLALGTDPLTQNRYAYVNGDPVNYSDPTGHRLECGEGASCRQWEKDNPAAGRSTKAAGSGGSYSGRAKPKPTPEPEKTSGWRKWGNRVAKVALITGAVVGTVAACAGSFGTGCATAAGAAIGASMGALSCKDSDSTAECLRKIAAGGAGGAVAGATFGLGLGALGTGVGGFVAAGAVSGGAGNAVTQLAATGEIDGGQLVASTAAGGLLGGLGRAAAGPAQRLASKVTSSLRGKPAAEAGAPTAQQIIQSTARSQAARGVDELKGALSQAERAAMEETPELASRMLGQSVHRSTADALEQSYPGRFWYRTRGPDFVDRWTGEMLELTTPGQVASHVARPGYGRSITMCTYVLPTC